MVSHHRGRPHPVPCHRPQKVAQIRGVLGPGAARAVGVLNHHLKVERVEGCWWVMYDE